MADFSHRPGWWLASDGRWYPPQLRPGAWAAEPGAARRSGYAAGPVEVEYRVWRILRDQLSAGEMIFSGRRMPGTAASVDHVVVAPSGVWVIDAKKWKGMSTRAMQADAPAVGHSRATPDIAAHLQRLCADTATVAGIVGDPSVPVHPVMAVLPDQCAFATALRLRWGKTLDHPEVLICTPRTLVQQIKASDQLGLELVLRVGYRLDAVLAHG